MQNKWQNIMGAKLKAEHYEAVIYRGPYSGRGVFLGPAIHSGCPLGSLHSLKLHCNFVMFFFLLHISIALQFLFMSLCFRLTHVNLELNTCTSISAIYFTSLHFDKHIISGERPDAATGGRPFRRYMFGWAYVLGQY